VLVGLFLYVRGIEPQISLDQTAEFTKFQFQWLAVYYMVMFSDWLQGPYVYALYSSYGFGKEAIAILFIVGFGSSSIFGTFIGALADKYGRKRLSIVFGILYSIACLTKLSPNFYVLLVGRLLSGVATSLLFSVFEAWMVCEHNQRGFASQLLTRTFSLAVFGNGIVAILAGVVASFAVMKLGFVSPFIISMFTLIISTIYIYYFWGENFGNSEMVVSKIFYGAFDALVTDRRVLILGSVQSLFEASMYIFVFLWTPMLEQAFDDMKKYEDMGLHGLIFASFMVCIMIGSSTFRAIETRFSIETCYLYTLAISSGTFFFVAILRTAFVTYFGFLVFEICCGLHFVCIGTLRSRYIPEESRSGVMNFFRIPLNIIVVVILVFIDSLSNEIVFFMCALALSVSAALQFLLTKYPRQESISISGMGSH